MTGENSNQIFKNQARLVARLTADICRLFQRVEATLGRSISRRPFCQRDDQHIRAQKFVNGFFKKSFQPPVWQRLFFHVTSGGPASQLGFRASTEMFHNIQIRQNIFYSVILARRRARAPGISGVISHGFPAGYFR